MGDAIAARGEACLRQGGRDWRVRATFARLVAAEQELGPLFALVERAAAGGLTLAETVALLWWCLEGERPAREAFGEMIVAEGLAAATPAVRVVLAQILAGRG
ncbi:MAG: gene transfer agent family protein [Alphaproteobacteria bacterium]|nr:gene transfer agent family protein [Alphaproteobacteria bacterium]